MAEIMSSIVELVVFKRSDRGPLYLILQRSSTDELYPGLWQIVTGTIEAGETPFAAALRELGEETSLVPVRQWLVPLVDTFFEMKTNSIQMCPLFAVEVGRSAEPTLSAEHKRYQWVDEERAQECLVWPGHHRAIETVHHYIVPGSEAARLTEININHGERKRQ